MRITSYQAACVLLLFTFLVVSKTNSFAQVPDTSKKSEDWDAEYFNSKSEALLNDSTGKMLWWDSAKFGMFIHWGLYSEYAGYWQGRWATRSSHFMIFDSVPLQVYSKITAKFNPVNFDGYEWAKIAKDAGMQYMVITSKHHEGFSMFDSPSSDYDIVDCTPYGKDPMKELANACRKEGIKFGFYYSLGRDWEDPDVPTDWPFKAGRSNVVDYPDEDAKVFNKYFERKVKPQVKELLTQYGDIDILWFDTPEMISKEESKELRELILSIQPNCIINSRIGNDLGDYQVKEKEIFRGIEDQYWESCMIMSNNWGFAGYDTFFRSPELLMREFLDIVSKGGNLLLNNGPNSKGEITGTTQDVLSFIGKWVEKNGDGIFGSDPWHIPQELLYDTTKAEDIKTYQNPKGRFKNPNIRTDNFEPVAKFTTVDDELYVYVCSPAEDVVSIKALGRKNHDKISKLQMLGTEDKVVWKQKRGCLEISTPKYKESDIRISGYRVTSKK